MEVIIIILIIVLVIYIFTTIYAYKLEQENKKLQLQIASLTADNTELEENLEECKQTVKALKQGCVYDKGPEHSD